MKLASTLLLSILLSEQCHHFWNPRYSKSPSTLLTETCCQLPTRPGRQDVTVHMEPGGKSPAERSFIFSHLPNNPCPECNPTWCHQPPGSNPKASQISQAKPIFLPCPLTARQNAGPNPTVPAMAYLNMIQPHPKSTKTQAHMILFQI